MDILPVLHHSSNYDFISFLDKYSLDLKPVEISTLQMNITYLCNQACLHCHVDASPKRTEQMQPAIMQQCLEILSHNPQMRIVDITGGAPELHPDFCFLVQSIKDMQRHVIIRHNLTVQADPHPLSGQDMGWLPEFFAAQKVEIISSLPYFQEFFTDRQRGKGVFNKSIKALQTLNRHGYGMPGTNLMLNLVYNPAGAFLPAAQQELQEQFKHNLSRLDIYFNNLFTITNMPIHRFAESLKRRNTYDEYMQKLMQSFNPAAAAGIMCRNMISVGYDGRLYDCDFNQMLDMQIYQQSKPLTVFDFDAQSLLHRSILFDSHCFGCTAGAGSSCGGATV
jgi:radical SAM/Cys-rich protein